MLAGEAVTGKGIVALGGCVGRGKGGVGGWGASWVLKR